MSLAEELLKGTPWRDLARTADPVQLLAARLEVGELSEDEVVGAARSGHSLAQQVVGPHTEHRIDGSFQRRCWELELLDHPAAVAWALDCAARVEEVWRRWAAWNGFWDERQAARDLLELARGWLRHPSEGRRRRTARPPGPRRRSRGAPTSAARAGSGCGTLARSGPRGRAGRGGNGGPLLRRAELRRRGPGDRGERAAGCCQRRGRRDPAPPPGRGRLAERAPGCLPAAHGLSRGLSASWGRSRRGGRE